MKRSKKQRRERIYEIRNSEKRTAQNEQHTAKHTAAVIADEIKWRWQWTKKITETETTTIMMMIAAVTAMMTMTN